MTLAIDVVQPLQSFMAKSKKKRGEEDGIDLFLRLVADVALRLPHWRGNTWRRHFDTIDEVRMRFQYDRKTSHTAHNTIEKI